MTIVADPIQECGVEEDILSVRSHAPPPPPPYKA
jgi:hypothetical protein